MIFSRSDPTPLYVSRSDPLNPLSSYSKHGFELDGAEWPSVEHYYQAMKFESDELRKAVLEAEHPDLANKLGKKNKKSVRDDWEQVRETYMTRGVYIKCRSHTEVADALLATGDQKIVESSQYDYYWGCGRDGRGHNTFGRVLMGVRDKLREERLGTE